VARMRGLHDCELCSHQESGYQATRGEEELYLGSAEIRVFGSSTIVAPGRFSAWRALFRRASKDGPPLRIVYAAPDMIYHYVVDHHYRPSDEFIQAVLESNPAPGSPEYESLVGHYVPS
jgi:hypothetical protein